MFIVTNREIHPSKSGFDQLGPRQNQKGSNELRIVEAHKSGNKWVIKILPDELPPDMIDSAGISPTETPIYASEYAARAIFKRIREEKKNLLFFVHGYNNDIQDILERAARLEEKYGVEVLCFSWPANGGGIKGALSYKSDQQDAKGSVIAFERCLEKMSQLFNELTEKEYTELKEKTEAKYQDTLNAEKRDEHLMKLLEKICPFTINMMVHSMGNLLYKKTLQSTVSDSHKLLFDNVILLAADVNNQDHAKWVDKIPVRKSVYITINENDFALGLSRAKLGDDQLARLGHHRKQLNSKEAIYVDFTNAPLVDKSHAYFEDNSVKNKTSKAFQFFLKVFNGKHPDEELVFDSGLNSYKIKP